MNRSEFPLEFCRFPPHWDIAPFEEVITDATGGNPKVKKADYFDVGDLPIIDQGQAFIGGYTDDLANAAKIDTPCILFGDHTNALK